MNARTLVYKTMEFDHPERIPHQLWALPWAHIHHKEMVERLEREFPNDLDGAPSVLGETLKTEGDPFAVGQHTDEWGCCFENRQEGIIGEVKDPLVVEEDWSDFEEKVHIPREHLTFDKAVVNDFCRSAEKFTYAGYCPRPFERMQFIRGTENLYVDLALDPGIIAKPLKMIHDFYCEVLEEWAKTEVDALNIMDDWGAQNALLIHPDTWVEIFKPLYKDYIDIAHSHGKKILMHSDGNTAAILPHLADLGLDAINAQIFCIGLDNLKDVAGRITFWGEIDRQNLLPYGTEQEISDAVHDVYRTLYKNGGTIAQCEFGPGAKPENVYRVFQTWKEIK